MAVLKWPLCTPEGYVWHIIPIATSARHSAWCISWGETQRQSIYSDPAYWDGYYAEREQSKSRLGAARMAALLTYQSRDSFKSRLGRAQGGKGTKVNSQLFNVQSYLRYQGDKFTAHFNANCYIHITHKLDMHDVACGCSSSPSDDSEADLPRVLAMLPPRTLVISRLSSILCR
ncbi:Alpha/Beta hydrolase protein [Cyathus striatus]|nr:Alpha/Beta hydrolase protein [Cyathus striatus]